MSPFSRKKVYGGEEFIKESLHITNGEIKRRDGELLALRATCW